MPRVLLAEDEALIRLALQEDLESAGHEVVTASDGWEAQEVMMAGAHHLAAAVFDVNLRTGPSGYALARQLRAVIPDLPVVLLTADGAGPYVAAELGRAIHVGKPSPLGAVSRAVAELLSTA